MIAWVAALAKRQERRIPVRLVKGAYWDTEIKRTQELGLCDYPVFTRKASTDTSYLAAARTLFAAGNSIYPQIAADYRRGFAVLESLPCDLFLGAHGGYFDLKEKYARFQGGDRNAFIDPAGYKAYIADRKHAFEAELARQAHARS